MRTFLLMLAFVLVFAEAKTALAEGDELISLLTDELKITDDQAKGGAGALFKYAKESLSSGDFDKVTEAVPDMAGYLGAIPDLGGGGNTGMLGKATQTLTGMPAVTKAFEKLGLSQEMVGMFTPLLVKYVDDKGGKAVGDLLRKVFK
ncbi:MAG: DUF2780 domain-containing protein [bacterium]|jgi:hypothetical protein